MKALALSAIRLYQRFISPYKGFCCAYRAYTSHASCSALGYRAIQRYGIRHGMGILRKRFAKCGAAHRRLAPMRRILHRQGGFCDAGCDLPCDIPCNLDSAGAVCDVLSCCDAGDCGDWGSSRKKRRKDEEVYLPPGNGKKRSLFRR